MRITATLQVYVKIKGHEDPEKVHDKVIQKLINVCDGWLNGDTVPKIKISYTLDDDNINAKTTSIN